MLTVFEATVDSSSELSLVSSSLLSSALCFLLRWLSSSLSSSSSITYFARGIGRRLRPAAQFLYTAFPSILLGSLFEEWAVTLWIWSDVGINWVRSTVIASVEATLTTGVGWSNDALVANSIWLLFVGDITFLVDDDASCGGSVVLEGCSVVLHDEGIGSGRLN